MVTINAIMQSVITRDETTYEGWPFPIVDDSNCEKQQQVNYYYYDTLLMSPVNYLWQIHECTRGCKYLILNLTATPRTVDSDINPCIEGCVSDSEFPHINSDYTLKSVV